MEGSLIPPLYPITKLRSSRRKSSILLSMQSPGDGVSPPKRRPTRWLLLLLLPYAGLLFPQIYARSTPTLFGFPFFYWYQFAWVLLGSAIMAIVYLRTRD